MQVRRNLVTGLFTIDLPDYDLYEELGFGMSPRVDVTENELKEGVRLARVRAAANFKLVRQCLDQEARGLTYSEVTAELTGAPLAAAEGSDEKYHASEDLMFLFGSLAELWRLINDGEYLLARPEEEAF